ncbi:MAG: hypothetical protein JWM44_3813 [Bacilli bacterium]|nr:hypothetical protein [Bacilli bacterium]
MKKIIALIFLLNLLASTSVFADSSDGGNLIPDAVMQYSHEKGFNIFNEKAAHSPTEYGFQNLNELSKATVGDGFQIHRIDAVKLNNATPSSLIDISTGLSEWLFIVNVDGVPKSTLLIGFSNDHAYFENMTSLQGRLGEALQNFRKLVAEKGEAQTILLSWANNYYFAAKIGVKEYNLPVAMSSKANPTLLSADETIQLLQEKQKMTSSPAVYSIQGSTQHDLVDVLLGSFVIFSLLIFTILISGRARKILGKSYM